MLVTALQCDVSSLGEAHQMIDAHKGSDLYVLPEMWNTGFTVHPQADAIPESEAVEIMSTLAKEHGAAVAGSIAVKSRKVESEEFRNRFYFAEPDGRISHYDKHHLFTVAKEDKAFEAGQQRTIVEYKGVRIMLLVCYDLRFPVWSRSQEDYDCILYVANWPTLRIEPMRTLLKARAIENQCYVVGVNRVGGLFGGRSAIIAPDGTVIEEGSADKQEAVSAEIDMQALEKLRKKFPVLKDRDDVEIKRLKS
ncbi:MAG: nitrilase family protein [Bacteroidaceae bacterium]|nr:nitrilase family protein [Bacteroidaceae bacterium]MBP5731294.1 nitrilase family protein [Bacteroidaceae bacterium]